MKIQTGGKPYQFTIHDEAVLVDSFALYSSGMKLDDKHSSALPVVLHWRFGHRLLSHHCAHFRIRVTCDGAVVMDTIFGDLHVPAFARWSPDEAF